MRCQQKGKRYIGPPFIIHAPPFFCMSSSFTIPSQHFSSFDECMDSLREQAKEHGFYLKIGRGDKVRGKWEIRCAYGGTYDGSKMVGKVRVRNTTTKLNDCPFKINVKRLANGSVRCNKTVLDHNHTLGENVGSHPQARKLSSYQKH